MTTLALSSALLKVRRASRRNPELRRSLVVSPRQAILGFRGLEPEESAALLSLHRDDIAALTQVPTRRPRHQPLNPTGTTPAAGPHGPPPQPLACVNVYPPAPSLETARPRKVASAVNRDGRLEVFYVNVEGVLVHKWQLAPGGAPAVDPEPNQPPPRVWSDATPLVAFRDEIDRVVVGMNDDGRLEVFFVASGVLYHVWETTTDFASAPGPVWAGPAVLVNASISNFVTDVLVATDGKGQLNVFYVGTRDNIFLLRQLSANGGWAAGGETPLAPATRDMAVGTNCDGRLELFFIDSNDVLQHVWELSPGGSWSRPSVLVNAFTNSVAVQRSQDLSLSVFYATKDGALQRVQQVSDPYSYSPSVNCSFTAWGEPQTLPSTGEVTRVYAFTNWDQRLEVVYTDANDIPFHVWEDTTNGVWDPPEQFGWSAESLSGGLSSDGRLEVFYQRGDGFMFHNWQTSRGQFWAGEYPLPEMEREVSLVWAEEKFRILGPQLENWQVNDHCFVPFVSSPGGGPDNVTWHMFGIVAPNPEPCGDPQQAGGAGMGHATSPQPESGWSYQAPAFFEPQAQPPPVSWAPHVRRTSDGWYWMVYCDGGPETAFGIVRRRSRDLASWDPPSRAQAKTLLLDGYQARDPMLLWLPEEQVWVLYYCATSSPTGGHHVVKYCVSTSGDPNNLDQWSEPAIAYTDYHAGDQYGPTESPFVVHRGPYFYLFIGPRPYDAPCCDPSCSSKIANFQHPGYVGTDVFRSARWDCWTNADYVGHIDAHASEIFCVGDQWYASSGGIGQGGLYLMRLHWEDGIVSCSTEW